MSGKFEIRWEYMNEGGEIPGAEQGGVMGDNFSTPNVPEQGKLRQFASLLSGVDDRYRQIKKRVSRVFVRGNKDVSVGDDKGFGVNRREFMQIMFTFGTAVSIPQLACSFADTMTEKVGESVGGDSETPPITVDNRSVDHAPDFVPDKEFMKKFPGYEKENMNLEKFSRHGTDFYFHIPKERGEGVNEVELNKYLQYLDNVIEGQQVVSMNLEGKLGKLSAELEKQDIEVMHIVIQGEGDIVAGFADENDAEVTTLGGVIGTDSQRVYSFVNPEKDDVNKGIRVALAHGVTEPKIGGVNWVKSEMIGKMTAWDFVGNFAARGGVGDGHLRDRWNTKHVHATGVPFKPELREQLENVGPILSTTKVELSGEMGGNSQIELSEKNVINYDKVQVLAGESIRTAVEGIDGLYGGYSARITRADGAELLCSGNSGRGEDALKALSDMAYGDDYEKLPPGLRKFMGVGEYKREGVDPLAGAIIEIGKSTGMWLLLGGKMPAVSLENHTPGEIEMNYSPTGEEGDFVGFARAAGDSYWSGMEWR